MAGFILLLLARTPVLTVMAIAFVGFRMSWGAPVQSRFMDKLGDAERAIGFALVRTVYMSIGSLESVVVGALSDVYGWTIAFGILAVIIGLEVVLLAMNVAFDLDY